MTRKTVKLSTLKLSPLNVRKSEPTGIEAMAADITAHGIIQNLVVYKEGRNHMVSAGGRRFRGLKLLQKEKKIDGKYDVPVDVRPKAEAIEISLSENDQREDMHPADLLGAYRALVENDMGVNDIAARHGKSEGYVRRILKLAGLHEDILTAFAADQIGMDAAQAYCLTDDTEKQKEIFDVAGGTAHQVRRMLTEEKLTTKHRLFSVVSVEKYKEGGGTVTADLFDSDGHGYANEPEIFYPLVEAEFARLQEEYEGQGWKEAEMLESQPHNYWSLRVMDPEGRKEPNKKQKAALAKNQKEQKVLLDNESEDHAFSDELYSLQREESEIEEALAFFTGQQKAEGKMLIYLDHSGELTFKAINLAKAKRDGNDQKAPKPDYSAKLVASLDRIKTLAVKEAVAGDADLATDILLHTMFQQVVAEQYHSDYALAIRSDAKAVIVDDALLETSTIATVDDLAKDQFPTLKGSVGLADIRKLGAETKSRLMAVLVASQIDAQTIGFGQGRERMNELAREAKVDIAAKWSPNEAFFNSLTKPVLLKILTEYCGKEAADNCKSLKKSALAAEMVKRLDGKNYMPPVLSIEAPKKRMKKAA
tara:strand:+ start:1298 stop:3073 length:1776 start_codon:yes stop_codon:yes gene_type:complete